jgi:hypothetical protein
LLCRFGGGGECSSWRWRAASQSEFLQGQVVLHLQEGGDGGVAGFGGVGGLLFSLGEASEGRLVGRLPVRGSSAVRVRNQADGELLRLDAGGRCSSGSRVQGGLGGAGGGGWSWRSPVRRPVRTCCAVERRGAGARSAARQGGEKPACEALLGREERGRRVKRCSARRKREESRSCIYGVCQVLVIYSLVRNLFLG